MYIYIYIYIYTSTYIMTVDADEQQAWTMVEYPTRNPEDSLVYV